MSSRNPSWPGAGPPNPPTQPVAYPPQPAVYPAPGSPATSSQAAPPAYSAGYAPPGAPVAPYATPVAPTGVPVAYPPVPVTPMAAAPVPVRLLPVSPVVARPVPIGGGAPVVVTRHPGDDEEDDKAVEERIIKAAPPWMVSLVVHMIGLVVMGLIYFAQKETKQVTVEAIYAEDLGVQLVDDRLTSGLMEQVDVEIPALSLDTLAANDPFAAPPQVNVTLDGTSASDSIVAPSIGLALTGREKGAKSSLLGKYGGNATTEECVRLGLEWLKANQNPNGSWSLVGPYPSGAGIENRCAATAMALLAFQGAGHTHKDGDYKKEVAKGWKFLLAQQDKDGMFYHEGVHHQQLYAQAQATIAICELYGMTKDKEYRIPAQRAVDYAIKIQAPEGGWRYTPGQDSDTSVTGWFVIALQSAMMAGLEVPSPALEKITKYLDSVGSENQTRYAYRPGSGPTETMTAEALLCRQYLNWKHDDPRLAEGVNLLLQYPIRWDFDSQNVYYWYYATQVMHHMEGDAWKKWNAVMREVIPKHQVKTGRDAGSWPPENDRWGGSAGRLYETCLCIYMLEVYYRHLPIYKWKQQ